MLATNKCYCKRKRKTHNLEKADLIHTKVLGMPTVAMLMIQGQKPSRKRQRTWKLILNFRFFYTSSIRKVRNR